MIKEIPPNLNYSFPIVAIAFTGMEYICSYIGECPRDSWIIAFAIGHVEHPSNLEMDEKLKNNTLKIE
jgi:hypothetical protein